MQLRGAATRLSKLEKDKIELKEGSTFRLFPKNRKKIEGNERGCSADFGEHSKNFAPGDFISVSYGQGLLKVVSIESIEEAQRIVSASPSENSARNLVQEDVYSKSDFWLMPKDKAGKKERRMSEHHPLASDSIPAGAQAEDTEGKLKKVRFFINLSANTPRKESFDLTETPVLSEDRRGSVTAIHKFVASEPHV